MAYNSAGTLGDAFFIVLKLLNKEVRTINHYTVHKKAYPQIKEILSLLGDIEFNIRNSRAENSITGFLEEKDNVPPFPEFNLPDIKKFNLPDKYAIIQLQAGVNIEKTPWKKIGSNVAEHLNNLPTVLLGTDKRDIKFLKRDVIDLRNKTSLLECLSVVRSSKAFYGNQGLLAFFALSQKVNSKIWLKSPSDNRAVKCRIERIPEWKKLREYISV